MNRRQFLSTSVAAGAYLSFPGSPVLFGAENSSPLPYDLVAVKNGEPGKMFDAAIEALNGMKTFVKKGHTVVLKPNIGWDVTPDRAGNTNPQLVKRVIEHCFNAGAKQVYVFDHTCDNWQRSYSHSGIEAAVRDAGGTLVPGNSENYYQSVEVPLGTNLRSAKEHELILEADVFINVPILKSHSSARMTAAMKNLMGNVWDRGEWHRNDLHQCIADFATFRKPDLNVIDAYNVMKQNGPRGVSVADVVTMKAQLVTTDIVTADAAAAKLFGLAPNEIRYITIASEKKTGRADLEHLAIKRITL